MFERKSEIRPFFEDADLAPFAREIEHLCMPALAFEQADSAAVAAGRLGGAPMMPQSLAWPERPPYRDAKALSEKFGRRSMAMARSFQSVVPLHFIADIDLAAVNRTAALGDRLPDEGRLLFFWDPLCGTYLETTDTCRVIWDRSPCAALAPRETPAALAASLEGEHLPAAFLQKLIAPLGVWSIPDRFLMREIGSQALRDAFADAEWEDAWDNFSDYVIDTGTRQLVSGREVLPHRLAGWPIPEQSDPRYAAAAAAAGALDLLGHKPSETERKICEFEMHKWTLLLQVDLNDLCGVFAEGTVYFVMREADLKAQNFDRVHAVYQQT